MRRMCIIKTLDLSKALAENKRLADLEENWKQTSAVSVEEEAERKRQEEIRKQKEAEEQAKREAEEGSVKRQKLRKHRKPPQRSRTDRTSVRNG